MNIITPKKNNKVEKSVKNLILITKNSDGCFHHRTELFKQNQPYSQSEPINLIDLISKEDPENYELKITITLPQPNVHLSIMPEISSIRLNISGIINLTLCRCSITSISVLSGLLTNNVALKSLNIEGNKITTVPGRFLPHFTELDCLYLAENPIKDFNFLTHIYNKKHLTIVLSTLSDDNECTVDRFSRHKNYIEQLKSEKKVSSGDKVFVKIVPKLTDNLQIQFIHKLYHTSSPYAQISKQLL